MSQSWFASTLCKHMSNHSPPRSQGHYICIQAWHFRHSVITLHNVLKMYLKYHKKSKVINKLIILLCLSPNGHGVIIEYCNFQMQKMTKGNYWFEVHQCSKNIGKSQRPQKNHLRKMAGLKQVSFVNTHNYT